MFVTAAYVNVVELYKKYNTKYDFVFQSAWGHSNADHKRVVSAMWSPPEWDNGEIEFV